MSLEQLVTPESEETIKVDTGANVVPPGQRRGHSNVSEGDNYKGLTAVD